ncbi:fungal chitosanase [Thozetella sp. PMI_491]|nr:fungal chitosanase [Thozetella sp. PMI_491]
MRVHAPGALLAATALALPAAALTVPANVQGLYNNIKAKGSCDNKLASGFWSSDSSGPTSSYCGDHLADSGVIYLQGTDGLFVNMDVDCDGVQGGEGDDGRCGSSTDTQAVTSFRPEIRGYNQGVTDLNSNVHSYVVFGNEGTKANWSTYDPKSSGIEPLSVMAVVCGNKMFYGVWGDKNGDDGPHPMVGEASISLATACYGSRINGNSGHDADDVLYLAFPGSKAVPGAQGAKWNATSFEEFHSSIQALGDTLVASINGTSAGSSNGSNGSNSSTSNQPSNHSAGVGHSVSTAVGLVAILLPILLWA